MQPTQEGTTELELTRVPGERRLYALADVGTLRLQGWLGRTAVAGSEGRSWAFDRRGFWQRELVATDETGARCGAFDPRSIRRGGTLRWRDRELALVPASAWRERYELTEGDRVLAVLDGKGWGRRPVRLTLEEPLEPGLALFSTFVVRGLAEDASSAASGGAVAAVC